MKVAVFGASGFVGSAFVEKSMAQASKFDVVPIIHSSGSAWRLARRNFSLQVADLLSTDSIRQAVKGCSHIVNCTRGSEELMIKGLQNLLMIAKEEEVKRFVHLSSVAVYGDPPPAASERETAETHPEKGSYGWIKLKQDQLVQKAHGSGLPSIILCPPNITGPYSYFCLEVLRTIQAGRFAFLSDGQTPVNLVDVDNLVHAIQLSLEATVGTGERYFITDDEEVSWKELANALVGSVKNEVEIPVLDDMTMNGVATKTSESSSLWKSLKHMASDDVRTALAKDPILKKMLSVPRKAIAKFPDLEEHLRLTLGGGVTVERIHGSPSYHMRLISQQRRNVRHLCDSAKQALGYVPIVNFSESMRRFCSWYQIMHGTETGTWQLLKELERC